MSQDTGNVSGTINGITINFSPPSWGGYCFVCDTLGYEFISLTPTYRLNSTFSDFNEYICVVINIDGTFYRTPDTTTTIYKLININDLVFNRKIENIITPLVVDGEVIKNLYISPTGLAPVKGTIVTDGINKYISLENALYAKYAEE